MIPSGNRVRRSVGYTLAALGVVAGVWQFAGLPEMLQHRAETVKEDTIQVFGVDGDRLWNAFRASGSRGISNSLRFQAIRVVSVVFHPRVDYGRFGHGRVCKKGCRRGRP